MASLFSVLQCRVYIRVCVCACVRACFCPYVHVFVCLCGPGLKPHPRPWAPARCPVSDRSVRSCLSIAPSAAAEWLQATRQRSSGPSHQPHQMITGLDRLHTTPIVCACVGVCVRVCVFVTPHILLSSVKLKSSVSA